jgi:alpha-L-fucosidase 2
MKKLMGPNAEHDFHLTGPIDRWDEAVPLGNGLMGALVWGDGPTIKLSLDRGDMWDVRPAERFKMPDWNFATLKQLVAAGDQAKIEEIFEHAYRDSAFPSKIPAGRIELKFGKKIAAEQFSLDLRRAVGRVTMGKASIEIFCNAVEPVGMIRIQGDLGGLKIVPPAFGETPVKMEHEISAGSLSRLGYPAPQAGKSQNVQWTLQKCADGFEYAIVTAMKKVGAKTEIAFTVRTNRDEADAVEAGRKIVIQALKAGFDKNLAGHVAWWKNFWSQSAVGLPDKAIEQHYYLTQYFYGASSRRGAPPIPLQGVWTEDEGKLPPWKGDYHNDLNTQLTYWAYLSANHLEEGCSFLDFMWNLLPKFRKFAKDFYGAKGANIPGTIALDGTCLGGWSQYTYPFTAGAWVGQAFYLHWRYTMDREFLATRAYPFCREAGEFLESVLEADPGKNGKLKLPLSSSPEIHDNRLAAWLKPNSNFDLALMRWLFGALARMAAELKEAKEADRWQSILARLEDLAVQDGRLMVNEDEFLTESHRHHSHLMGIHPLGIMNIENPDQAPIIEKSLSHSDYLGMQWWVGYSFPWMSCLAARARQGGKALNMLELYLKGFVSRNGFHLNGDFKNLGLSAFKYRPFTLEGNFAAAQAVHEILLQSWGGVVRVFPAVAPEWLQVGFEDLRVEGAFRVSARRENGRTVWVRVRAEKGGDLRLRDPFPGTKIKWNRPGVKKVKDDYQCYLKPGEVLEGSDPA